MPRSLDDGPSRIVPVRMPESEKQDAIEQCADGENLSQFVRKATRREVTRRRAAKRRGKTKSG